MGTKWKERQSRVLQMPASPPVGRPWKVLVRNQKSKVDERNHVRPYSERLGDLLRLRIDFAALLTDLAIVPARDFSRPAKLSGGRKQQ